MTHYFMELVFDDKGEHYNIVSSPNRYRPSRDETVVWSRPYIRDEDTGEYHYPSDVRKKYEELTGKAEFVESERSPWNIVPMLLADDDEVVYDCPCAWAQRVKNHAIYCENSGWLYAPRKCRRGPGSWREDGTPLQETCPGFRRNDR